MESGRPGCLRHPGFLAAFGALWLDEGEPEQALIWLERSLLLDPHNLGAQSDHALALAALGQPDGVSALALAWRDRADIPAALKEKLLPRNATSVSAPLPAVRLGGVLGRAWVNRGEATLLLGHESNLDHSPRLDAITLTAPEGPISLPVVTVPRRGAAVLADLSWQFARKASDGQVWRAGVNLASRHAPQENKTDWHQIQWAASGSKEWGAWRGQVNVDAAWIGGPLNEPFRTWRVRLAAERLAQGCTWLGGLEAEGRTQSRTASADSTTLGLLWTASCALPVATGWSMGGALRAAVDRPNNEGRPGGAQHFWSAGLRLQGPVGGDARVEVNLKHQRAADGEGYSTLLDNDARRRLSYTLLALEVAQPLRMAWATGAEAVFQVSATEQRSNLELFRHHGASVYTGIRWGW